MKDFDNSAHNWPCKIVELESVAYSGTNDYNKNSLHGEYPAVWNKI